MRLGQLSRKLDLKPTEIRELIRKEFNVEIDLDLNTRIEDSHADALSARFQQTTSPLNESVSAQPKPQVAEIKAEQVIQAVEVVPETVTVTEAVIAETASKSEEKDVFTPLPVDPNAELIKAPKIKLDGLKVVGKIELPQPKEQVKENTDENGEAAVAAGAEQNELRTEAPKSFKERRLKNPPVLNNDDEEYSIFKDKKGIYHFSQSQRENRKDSLERIKRNRQDDLRKLKKSNHYQQIVQGDKKTESPAKKAKKQQQKETRKQPEKPVAKGIWGKFVNWLKG